MGEGAGGDVGLTGSVARVGEFVGNGPGIARIGVGESGRASTAGRARGTVDVGVAVAGGLGEGVFVAVGTGGWVGDRVGTALGGGAGR